MAKSFKDLGIVNATPGFTGDKIKMNRVLNREITIIDYKIEKSKFKDNYLLMQIEVNGQRHVLFTGSMTLQNTIQQIRKEDFPITTTITEDNERYQFN